MSPAPPEVADLLARNRAWAEGRTRADAEAFSRQASGQAPPFYWLGCSDSRVPANEVVGLGPGEMFVHRNIANLAPAGDVNFQSTLQYAVGALKVRHVLVVGHHGCGGVRAALLNLKLGLIEQWLSPVREIALAHRERLDALPDEGARVDALSELNVLAQVASVAATPVVQEAWASGQPLSLHGLCYSLSSGLLHDLGARVDGPG